jgi:RNA polymerase sigma factor (sigma-70 family)
MFKAILRKSEANNSNQSHTLTSPPKKSPGKGDTVARRLALCWAGENCTAGVHGMESDRLDAVVRCIHRIAAGQVEHLSDRMLLDRYLDDRNDDAFAALVHRHAGLVLGVCQRIVHDRHASEDCFQAVFLVLATKAGSLKRHDMIGPWLHAVARRVALKANAQARSRSGREQHAARSLLDCQASSLEWRELSPVLDDAVARLPGKFRVPFVLCYLQGKTVREIARLQNLPMGTVASRLARARAQLRVKLVRQGITLTAGSLAVAISESKASALASQSLIEGTLKVSKLLVAGVGASELLSHSTVSLMRGTVPMTIFANLKSLTGILAALAIGVVLLSYCSIGLLGANGNAQERQAQDGAVQDPAPAQRPVEQTGDASNKLKTVSFLSLQRTPMDVYRLAAGDTLGLVIDGILGDSKQLIPVRQGENSNTPPVMGYPMVVREDGTIPLPQVPPLKVAGMSVAELEAALRQAYTVTTRRVNPDVFSAIVTLMRKRTVRVVVIREDVGGDSTITNRKADHTSRAPGANRGIGQVLELPFGDNDLLTVLVRSGGIPGANAADAVVIERTRLAPNETDHAGAPVSVKNGAGEATTKKYVKQTLHIPLRLRANARVPFTEDDITFQNGDIVFVPARGDN